MTKPYLLVICTLICTGCAMYQGTPTDIEPSCKFEHVFPSFSRTYIRLSCSDIRLSGFIGYPQIWLDYIEHNLGSSTVMSIYLGQAAPRPPPAAGEVNLKYQFDEVSGTDLLQIGQGNYIFYHKELDAEELHEYLTYLQDAEVFKFKVDGEKEYTVPLQGDKSAIDAFTAAYEVSTGTNLNDTRLEN